MTSPRSPQTRAAGSHPTLPATAKPNRRRGSLYLPTLLVGGMVTALAIGGLLILRSTARTSVLRNELAQARFAAVSGIEAARAFVAAHPDWRTRSVGGLLLPPTPAGVAGASYSVTVSNPAGLLDRSPIDPVTVVSVGKAGAATSTLTATFAPLNVTPISSLRATVGAAGGIHFSSATVRGRQQLIATNGAITTSLVGNNIEPDVEATLTVTGLGFGGNIAVLSPPEDYPRPDVFSHYIAVGAPLSYGSLPGSGGSRTLTRTLISPSHNPFGPTHPDGIYILNCGGGSLTISNTRIIGTLVVLNAASVTLAGAITWEPARGDLPALLVQGPLDWRTDDVPLRESDGGINYNPPGTPFPYVTTNSDTTVSGETPSYLNGLVYAAGNITFSRSPVVHSAYTSGQITFSGTVTLAGRDERNLIAPPPGFFNYNFGLLPGSYR